MYFDKKMISLNPSAGGAIPLWVQEAYGLGKHDNQEVISLKRIYDIRMFWNGQDIERDPNFEHSTVVSFLSSLLPKAHLQIERARACGKKIELILDSFNIAAVDVRADIYTWLPTQNNRKEISKWIQLNPVRELYVYLQDSEKFSIFLPLKKLMRQIKKLNKENQNLKIRGPRDLFIYDFAMEGEMRPFQTWEPLWVTGASGNSTPDFSIIIPSYNNLTYLKIVLLHLFRQKYDKLAYEIIIVDDGSEDQTSHVIQELCEYYPNIKVKFILFPRLSTRRMGDAKFRAGLSRNIGVHASGGKYLVFLDSDVIVGPAFLQRYWDLLKDADVVQSRRFDLNKEISDREPLYKNIQQDHLLFDDQYWSEFNSSETEWDERSYGWKYTCTHSLGIRKELFERIGLIRPCYIRYGFEDTDLGYQLWQSGARFRLADENTYHLYHRKERSEFQRDIYKRRVLLKNTCKIFLRHFPDPDLYSHFRSMI